MFSKLKLQARYALLPAEKYIRELIAPVFIIIIPLYFLLFLITVYYPQMYPLRLSYAVFISIFALPIIELAMQIKLILAAKGSKEKVKISFKYALKSCWLKLMLRFLKIRNFILYQLLPLTMALVFFAYLRYNPVSLKAAVAYLCGTAFATIAGVIFYIISVQKYSRAYFCLAAYENITPFEAVRLSEKTASKSNAGLFSLKLSFLPWFIVCVAVVPLFFVVPYYKQSLTCYFLNNR